MGCVWSHAEQGERTTDITFRTLRRILLRVSKATARAGTYTTVASLWRFAIQKRDPMQAVCICIMPFVHTQYNGTVLYAPASYGTVPYHTVVRHAASACCVGVFSSLRTVPTHVSIPHVFLFCSSEANGHIICEGKNSNIHCYSVHLIFLSYTIFLMLPDRSRARSCE